MSVASKEENTGDVFDASKMNYKEKKKFYNSKNVYVLVFVAVIEHTVFWYLIVYL